MAQNKYKIIKLNYAILLALVIILVAILNSRPANNQQSGGVEGCFLLVTSEACLVATELLRLKLEAKKETALVPLVDRLEDFCQTLEDMSPESILLRALEPQLRTLFDAIADGAPVQQLAPLLRQVVSTIGSAGR